MLRKSSSSIDLNCKERVLLVYKSILHNKEMLEVTKILYESEGLNTSISQPPRSHCWQLFDNISIFYFRNGEKIPLRGNRFSRCHSIQFFIEENQDDT